MSYVALSINGGNAGMAFSPASKAVRTGLYVLHAFIYSNIF